MRNLVRALIIGSIICIIVGAGYWSYISFQPKSIYFTLKGPFAHEQGYCWIANFPGLANWADSESQPENSSLIVYENGRVLGPAHSLHDNIRKIGGGRYSHWGKSLYFSISDNSDPNKNGRQYSIKASTSSQLPIVKNISFILLGLTLTGGWVGLLLMTIFCNITQIKKWLLITAIFNLGIIIFLFTNILPPLMWYARAVHILIFLSLLCILASCFLIYNEIVVKSKLTLGKKFAFTIVTLWSVIGTFILVFEVFFRIIPVYDTLSLNPGVKYFWPDYVNYPLNSMGYRDRAFTLEKSPNTYRIIVVGDSYVEGSGCTRKETFPKVLAGELNRRLQAEGCSKRVEAYNLGRCGANTVEEVDHILKEAPLLKPDLIILAYVLNDPEVHPPDIKTFNPPAWVTEIHKIFLEDVHSYAYYWFFTKFTLFKGSVSSSDEYCVAIHNVKYHGWLEANAAVAKLGKFLKVSQMDCFAIIIPEFNHKKYPEELKIIHKQVVQAMHDNGLMVIDLLKFYEENNKDLTAFAFSAFDQHPNAMAQSLLGKYLSGLVWKRPSFGHFCENCFGKNRGCPGNHLTLSPHQGYPW